MTESLAYEQLWCGFSQRTPNLYTSAFWDTLRGSVTSRSRYPVARDGADDEPTRVARPLSETHACYDLARRILDDLILPWEVGEFVGWMYSTPRAAARAMLDSITQFSGVRT